MSLISVLDKGYIRLVDSMGDDLSICRSARVSFNAEWRTGEDEGKDDKLIGYLIKHAHWSPFESVVMTFEVKCPVFVARQWMRHRSQSYNEISARYTEMDEDYYVPDILKYGIQDAKNKQARNMPPSDNYTDEELLQRAIWQREQEAVMGEALRVYRKHLAEGMPREIARDVLPFALYTRFFGTVNLRNAFGFIKLRADGHAQYEIRVYAEAMLELIRTVAPVATKYFELGM